MQTQTRRRRTRRLFRVSTLCKWFSHFSPGICKSHDRTYLKLKLDSSNIYRRKSITYTRVKWTFSKLSMVRSSHVLIFRVNTVPREMDNMIREGVFKGTFVANEGPQKLWHLCSLIGSSLPKTRLKMWSWSILQGFHYLRTGSSYSVCTEDRRAWSDYSCAGWSGPPCLPISWLSWHCLGICHILQNKHTLLILSIRTDQLQDTACRLISDVVECGVWPGTAFLAPIQGPVVQNIISLTSSLVVKILTVLVSTII